MLRLRECFSLCFVALLLFTTGCGGTGEKLGSVKGKITYKGEPLSEARIEFDPVEEGRPATGFTDAEGNYTLSFVQNEAGAKVGKHIVRIRTEKNVDGIVVKEKLPPKYHEKSELTAEVTSGPNEINFDLE